MSLEGETAGSGDNNTFDEELFSLEQLNQQWAEFDERIGATDPQERYTILQREIMRNTLAWQLYDQLDERGIPRLIDKDEDNEAARRLGFIEQLYREKMADISWMRKSAEDTLPYLDKALVSVVAYIRESRLQRRVVSSAAAILHDAVDGNFDQGSGAKKAIQAELHIQHKLSFDDPWMQFFNEITPGEGIISLSHPTDKPYVEAVQADMQGFEEDSHRELIVLETAIDLATYKKRPDFWGDTAEVARTLTAIAGLYIIATAGSDDEYGANAQKNQRLWHYGYTTGLDTEVLHEVIDYFTLEP